MSASRPGLPEAGEAGVSAGEGGGTPSGDDQGPATAATALFSSTLRLARDVVDLAAAEVRLAALSGATMVMLVLVTAALIVIGWTFIAAVVAYLLVGLGLPWPAAGLLVAAAHGVVAFVLWRTVVRLSRSLTLPELRRSVLSSEE